MWPNAAFGLAPELQKSTEIPNFPLACFAPLPSSLWCQEDEMGEEWAVPGLCRAGIPPAEVQGLLRCSSCTDTCHAGLEDFPFPSQHLCRARGEFLQVPTLHLLVYNDSKVVVLQDAGELPKAVLQADLNRTKRDIERFTSPGNGWALISGEIPCQGLAPGVKSSHI